MPSAQFVESITRRFAGFLLLLAIAALMAAAPVHAQQGRGTVSGVVQGLDGKPQAKARVFLQSSSGRAPHTRLTDAEGRFTFRNLRPGLYELKAQAGGNWSELQRNIQVRANREATVDLKLLPPAPPKPRTP